MSGTQQPRDRSTSASANISVRQAATAYLDTLQVPTTRRVYAQTIGKAAELLGSERALRDIEDLEVGSALQELWGTAAASTWNTRRSAVSSWLDWCRKAGYPGPAVPQSAPRRTPSQPPSATRIHSRAEIDHLTSRSDIPVRETTLWRMLYETLAPATDLLGLNVEDLDVDSRSARLTTRSTRAGASVGADQLALRRVFWGPATAQLLGDYLQGRTAGPVFLSTRPPRAGRHLTTRDVDPDTGYARLTYSSADKHLDRYTALAGPGTGWNLHELRVSSRLHTQLDQAAASVVEVWHQIGDLHPDLARLPAGGSLARLMTAARGLEESDHPLAAAAVPIVEAIATINRVTEVARAPMLSSAEARQAHHDLAETMVLADAAAREVRAAATRARAASGARR